MNGNDGARTEMAKMSLSSTKLVYRFPLTLEQELEVEKIMVSQLSQRLKEYFPWKFVLCQAILTILLSGVLIGLQIVLFVDKAVFNGASGLWGGVIGIIISVMRLVLMKNKNMKLFRVCQSLSATFVTPFMAIVLINGYAYSASKNPINVVMIAIGIFNVISTRFYLIMIKRCLRSVNQLKDAKRTIKHSEETATLIPSVQA